jgi:hypothetical protein
MTASITLVAAALSAVLSSGLTAAYLRSTMPATVPVNGAPLVTPETRPLATRLAEPAAPYRPRSAGGPLDITTIDRTTTPPAGFVRAWQRSWASTDEQVTTFLVEFAGEAQARSYAQGGTGRLAVLFDSPVPFVIDGVPGASGVSDTEPDADGHFGQAVVIHRDRFTALLVFVTNAARPGNVVADLSRRQWAALAP